MDQIRVLVRRELHSRFRRSRLGSIWIFLGPVFTAGVMVAAFSLIFGVSKEELANYSHYVLSGVVLIGFVNSGLTAGSGAITTNRHLIAKSKIAPFSLPITSLLVQLVSFLVGCSIVAFVGIFSGKSFNLWYLWALISLSMFVLGCGLLLGIAHVYFEDVGAILPIMLQMLVYVTPIFYREDFIPVEYSWTLEINPILHLLRVFRYGVGSTDYLLLESVVIAPVVGSLFLLLGISVHLHKWKDVPAHL